MTYTFDMTAHVSVIFEAIYAHWLKAVPSGCVGCIVYLVSYIGNAGCYKFNRGAYDHQTQGATQDRAPLGGDWNNV